MDKTGKNILIVGAGPGGLASGMILAHRGFKVTVFEKGKVVGGRSAPIELGDYTFDTGPTFLILRFVLNEIFEEAGRNVEDYLQFKRLEPMYRLNFHDREVYISSSREKMEEEIHKHFPGNEKGFDKFFKDEKERFEKLFPCLQRDYSTFLAFFDPIFLKAFPYVSLGRTLFGNLGRYFREEELKLCFTFQSKYLGMSPWQCPALFTIIPYMEHAYGVYHVMGGLNKICLAMARVIEEEGGEVCKGTPVAKLIIDGKTVKGVKLEDGTRVYGDDVIINADFGYAMSHLIEPGASKKYNPEKLKKKKFSCSTFMIYLGVNKVYDLTHHNIFFARDYQSNLKDIFDRQILSTDVSFYIQNASVTDPNLAPPGKSTLYILVPVPNNLSRIDWDREKESFKDMVLDKVIERTSINDLRENIEVEKLNTPFNWENDYNVYMGAEFNLAHNISQMLYFRPHNKFEEFEHCYIVGGGTHPGSGLPTIYESARISSNLICKQYDIPFTPPSSLTIKEG